MPVLGGWLNSLLEVQRYLLLRTRILASLEAGSVRIYIMVCQGYQALPPVPP